MNKRNTVQRTLVLEAVKNLRNHATAEEIYGMIAKKHPDISRGSVYRNLNLLSEIGEIKKREMPGGADRYDHQCHDHYHARCKKCGRVDDVEMDYMDNLQKSITNTNGFEFLSHIIIFEGLCSDCIEKTVCPKNDTKRL